MKVLKKPETITLYSRGMCGWCIEAKEWLEKKGWPYTLKDVGRDLEARKRASDLSGQTLVPVIEIDGQVLGDFDTGQLEDFLTKHGYLA